MIKKVLCMILLLTNIKITFSALPSLEKFTQTKSGSIFGYGVKEFNFVTINHDKHSIFYVTKLNETHKAWDV